MMKLFTCTAHADPDKLDILAKVLNKQQLLCDEVHVCVITNIVDSRYIDAIYEAAPRKGSGFFLEVYNQDCDKLPSPWLLTWVHKKLMHEKFQDPSYTHFMCIEDDIEVTPININYWLRFRNALKPYKLYPSFLRVEWNKTAEEWAMADSMRGDCFSVSNSPRLDLKNGHQFINLGRTYQGMFLYDRELMQEHINSITFDLFRLMPDWQERVVHEDWPLGLTEAAVHGLSETDVPPGCYSRNFIPYHSKYLMIDPCCFVHHLPDKYTNIPELEHGKVLIKDALCP